jgi:hypothetical protein
VLASWPDEGLDPVLGEDLRWSRIGEQGGVEDLVGSFLV